jgi:hypothetical protein
MASNLLAKKRRSKNNLTYRATMAHYLQEQIDGIILSHYLSRQL